MPNSHYVAVTISMQDVHKRGSVPGEFVVSGAG